MTERYLDVLTVHLRGYAGHPIPANLAEEIVLRVDMGAQVDLEQLADELKEEVGSGPRRIRQTITEMSWGASMREPRVRPESRSPGSRHPMSSEAKW